CTRERSSSESDEFNEPDLDSSDEWLPSESASSRDSSPDSHGRESSSRASRAGKPPRTHWITNMFPFTATPGPRNDAAELDSGLPADFLELFLTDELLQHIAQQTNLYASRGHAWKPVSLPELKTFFGLTFLTGYIRKPSLEMYWSVDEIDATPYFSQTMSRNRFQIIWRFLHYNDNTSLHVTDKMCKVRPVLDYLVERFKEMYQPGQNICIDEGMMQWRGRLSFKVYNPQKPVKYGIKSYVLCDSATGYCFNMQPYVGEARTLPEIVFSLLDRLTGNGYTLYMDNFYNSIALSERLLEAQTNLCGTLRKTRGEPQIIREVTKTDLSVEGKVVTRQDKGLVKMVTTCHQDKMESVDVWQRGHKEKIAQLKPECVVVYTSSMNGMDKLDQNVAYYPSPGSLSMFNAYILYRARNREYLEEGRRTPRAPYNTDPDSRLDGNIARHKLERLMSSSSKSRPARRCRVCTRRGQRRETKMWCKSCCVPLHPGECFTAYHTKQNYILCI
uniref:PiggyBac transposable element-derived protein domain-containing protein n=1 Tax=Neogobius melanostomus TaxID=47308 RepID=A0A8C6TMA0_9GOBI